jgi:hypothetical protein
MDSATIALLATNTLNLIVPVFQEVAGKAAPVVVVELIQLIRSHLSNKPAASEALEDLEQDPLNENVQGAVKHQLEKAMREDMDFATQIEKLLHEAVQTGISSTIVLGTDRGVAAGGDIKGNVFTGDIGGSLSIGGDEHAENG